ncbi:MAG: hypothetical protein J6S21_02190, partial [Victivallales bacterium]|nr:hypothetical protein [Victivallales bacterium]
TNLFMVLMLRDYWLFSGDDDTLRRHMPSLEKILKSIWALADGDGILRSSGVTADWNFFDWSFELNGYNCNGSRESMLSSLYLIAADVFRKLADAVAYDYDREELEQRCQLTASHFEERFVDAESGLIADEFYDQENKPVRLNTQLGHALWLLTGRASEARRQRFLATLTDDQCMMPDYYLHYFWFQAARMAGVLDVGLQRIRKYWGQCIDTGSSTLYEAGIHSFGKHAMNGAGSLCHGFGTIPVEFFQSIILGIAPVEAGFRTFTFRPELFDLEFAQGRVPTPNGNIRVRITRENAVIDVPNGTRAQLADGTYLAPGHHELSR